MLLVIIPDVLVAEINVLDLSPPSVHPFHVIYPALLVHPELLLVSFNLDYSQLAQLLWG